MQYVMLIYETARDFDARTTDKSSPHVAAWRAYYKSLVDAGAFVGGSPLQSFATATTVRLKDGKRRVQDGPYADTKEQLGGFIILELPTLDAALECAAPLPSRSHRSCRNSSAGRHNPRGHHHLNGGCPASN